MDTDVLTMVFVIIVSVMSAAWSFFFFTQYSDQKEFVRCQENPIYCPKPECGINR